MKEIKYDPNVITQEMIALRAREICCRGTFENAYPLVNQKINELNDLVTYLAIKELKKERETHEEGNAPKKPTQPPMPKCKPPKADWEIPSFMLKFKPKETITFYDMEGNAVATFKVDEE